MKTQVTLAMVLANVLMANSQVLCPEHWRTYIDTKGKVMCYFYNTDSMTFDEHREYCSGQGAILASIHDSAQNEFLTHLTNEIDADRLPWIGLRRWGGDEGQWKLEDATRLNFENWGAWGLNFLKQ